MFLEILVFGIFIATTVFNVVPIDDKEAARNSDTASEADTASYADTASASEIENNSPKEGWVEILKSNQSSYYANLARMRKNGSKVKIWRLTDHKTAEINGDYVYLSKKLLEEYDCKKEQSRQLFVSLYDTNMGVGPAAYTNSTTYSWESVSLHSDSDAIWEIACETKQISTGAASRF